MEHTRYATEDGLRGLLRYGLSGIEEQDLIDKVLTPELWDLSAIKRRVSMLRQVSNGPSMLASVASLPSENIAFGICFSRSTQTSIT